MEGPLLRDTDENLGLERPSTTQDQIPERQNNFDLAYAKYEAMRLAAVKERTAEILRVHIALVTEHLNKIGEAGNFVETGLNTSVAQPKLADQLDGARIDLDPRLALMRGGGSFDGSMQAILDQIREDDKLTEEEKRLLVAQLNQNNGSGSNYSL